MTRSSTARLGAAAAVLALAAAAVVGPVPTASATVATEAAVTRAAPLATVPLAGIRLTTTLVASGLTQPLLVRSAPDGTTRLFVVEKTGRVRTVVGGKVVGTFLDIRSLVSSAGERGLLGLAFPKDFATSHLVFASYVDRSGNLTLARWAVRSTKAGSVQASTRTVLLRIAHPATTHNGGDIAFGPDGYLYWGTGDGGCCGDPHNNAQSLKVLLGKVLRLNVRCSRHLYCIPATNPYATSKAYRHEILMRGLRNPWRFSFDAGGSLWIGEVGQDRYEEVDVVSPRRLAGRNLGWPCLEGKHVYSSSRCNSKVTYTAPAFELCHPELSSCPSARSNDAIIGGYVYAGSRYPAFRGTYVFGDYVSGRIWPYAGGIGASSRLKAVAGFGVDQSGEMYAVSLAGSLYRVGFRSA